MQKDNPKERLKNLAKSLNLGQTAFESKVGLSRGAISKMTESSSITSKVLEKITKHFPDVNSSWLLTGVGESFKTMPIEKSKHLSTEHTTRETSESKHEVTNESFREKYYKLLEKQNELVTDRFTELTELLKKVQKDLDDVLGNQITMTSMGQAMQDVLTEVLSPDHHADLRRSVDNKGVAIERVLKKTGNRIQIDK